MFIYPWSILPSPGNRFVANSCFDSDHKLRRRLKALCRKSLAQTHRQQRWLSRGGLVVVAMMLIWSVPLVVAQGAPGTVVINELAWMGSSSSSADEWIELHNQSAESVDLGNWRLTKLSSGNEVTMLTVPPGRAIPPNGYFVISNYAAGNASSSLLVVPDVVDTDVALSNSALQIKLYDAAGTLVDIADDGSGNPLSGKYVSAEKIFQSMERNPVPGDGTMPESWHTASRGIGFVEGKNEFGTPGTVNSNGRPVAQAGSDMETTVGMEINFDGSDSSDPENGPLSFLWNFGDGVTANEATPKHVYGAAGEYVVSVTVSDGSDSAVDTLKVVVQAASAVALTPVAQSPSAPEKEKSSPPVTSCRGITVSEVFPNPSGSDDGEFIEFYNPTEHDISLNGCVLWLNEKRKAVIHDIVVPRKKYALLEKMVSKLSLTNAGGAMQLLDTDSAEVFSLKYPKAPDGESWSIVGQEWTWTNTVTPNAKNTGPTDDEAEASGVKKTETEIPQLVGLADIQTIETGVLVQVRGVVSVAPDLLSARTIWVQYDATAVSAVLPEGAMKVTVGDEVELIGKVRLSQGRKRIAVIQDGVRSIAHGRPVEPRALSLDQLSPEVADQLVSVSGVISSSSGAKFLFDDGTAEGEAYIKSSTGIVKPRSAVGDMIVLTGIVSVTTSGIRILPRTIEDLRIERVLGATTSTPQTTKTLPTAPPNQNRWYWVLVAIGVLAAGVKPIITFLRKRKK